MNAGEVRYQWEISKDNGNSWNDIVEPALAIVGLGNAYRETESEGSPKFIELIATNDIDDLSKYRLYNYLNGSNGYTNYFTFSGSLKKGQMILLYRNDASHFSDYFGIQLSDYDMAINGTGLLDNLRGGDDVVELVYADNDGNLNWNNNTRCCRCSWY